MTGTEAVRTTSAAIGSSWRGPSEQLSPRASTRSPSSMVTTLPTVPPVSILAELSNTTVTKTGREQFSFAASTAAFASRVSLMVSIMMRSAPSSAPQRTTSAKISTASSKGRSPMGSSRRPVGPISSATYPSARPAARMPSRTWRTPARMIFRSSSGSP